MELLTGIFLGIVVAIIGIAASIFFLKDKFSFFLDQKVKQLFPDLLNKANEQLITMADQKLGAKKDAIEELVKQVKENLKDTGQKLETAERERVGSFSALKQELEGHKIITEQLRTTADGLKKVLSNNQLRGQFGEQVAEDLLRMSGFVSGTDYISNKAQGETSNRPDFCVLLPDGVKINVDVKFPYNNLVKMSETDDKAMKQEYLKAFEKDVKDKIKQVTTRDYINPADNTVDFAIIFIPNEMIFSFIYGQMNEIWLEAMKQKVIFAGPLNFTAILRLIRQSYSNFKYQKNVHKIINLITEFEIEFGKYNEEFTKIGERIEGLTKQYNEVDSRRTNKLVKTVEKIKLEEPNATNEIPQTTVPLIETELPKSEIVN